MVSELDIRRCASEDARPSRGADCEIPHRLEMETKQFLQECGNLSPTNAFSNLESPKKTITTSGGLRLLQEVYCYFITHVVRYSLVMILVSESKPYFTLNVRSHIGWRGERSILYKSMKTSSQHTHLNTVRLTTIRNGFKRQPYIQRKQEKKQTKTI